MPRCNIPPFLKPGDRLLVIAPSATLRETESLTPSLEIWQNHGYPVTLAPGYDGRHGYLAGTDPQRRQQLRAALADPEYRAIVCLRGGYGATRLLEDWVWPPESALKWLIGYSDVTALLWSLYTRQIASIHGPMMTAFHLQPPWSVQRLFQLLSGEPLPTLQGTAWSGGCVTGTLLAANLTVATHLIGTPHFPSLAGTILALEDVGEAPYRIDRYLTQWRDSGALQGVKGIALGRFSRCVPDQNIPNFSLEAVLRDRLSDLNIPIVADLPFGHDGSNAALPVGFPATLNGDQGTLDIHTPH